MSIVVNELVQIGITHGHPGRHGRLDPGPRPGRLGRHRVGRADEPGRRRRHRPAAVPGRRRPVPDRRPGRRGRGPRRRPPRRRDGVGRHVLRGPGALGVVGQPAAAAAAAGDDRRVPGAWASSTSRWRPGRCSRWAPSTASPPAAVCAIVAQRSEAEEPLHDVEGRRRRPGHPGRRHRRRHLVAAADRGVPVLNASQGRKWPRILRRTRPAQARPSTRSTVISMATRSGRSLGWR